MSENIDPRARFFDLLRAAVSDATLVKLTLGKPCGADATLQNIFVRPIALKAGPHFAFVSRHATRDLTKNFSPEETIAEIDRRLGDDFLDAHLFTTGQTAQLELKHAGRARLHLTKAIRGETTPSPRPAAHDRAKHHLVSADASWLRALGVTNDRGRPRQGMADKFSQIQKFAELLSHLLNEADLPSDRALHVVDMGAGKGYLTFAIADILGNRATVEGIEARPELVALCNRLAQENKLSNLKFSAGHIADASLPAADVLIALHACDTATDDALAKGVAAGAKLIVVAPCCQKELRPQLTAPPVLAAALRHGIFQERSAEFVTDALRAQLLEWAGYKTKVFEFISTEHTAKNLMIAAIKAHPPGDAAIAQRARDLAHFYGIRRQKLAAHLGFAFAP